MVGIMAVHHHPARLRSLSLRGFAVVWSGFFFAIRSTCSPRVLTGISYPSKRTVTVPSSLMRATSPRIAIVSPSANFGMAVLPRAWKHRAAVAGKLAFGSSLNRSYFVQKFERSCHRTPRNHLIELARKSGQRAIYEPRAKRLRTTIVIGRCVEDTAEYSNPRTLRCSRG